MSFTSAELEDDPVAPVVPWVVTIIAPWLSKMCAGP
jgi:hypothetical protein